MFFIIALITPQNSFFWVDFTCKGNVGVKFFDKKGKVVDSFVRGPGTAYLDNTACNYKYFVTFSDYDEKQRKNKSYKFLKKEQWASYRVLFLCARHGNYLGGESPLWGYTSTNH
ncbi:hypothetical protein [Peribacillus asahii]|uniref:hypothetical protein n=1 Tax=Peribacillus asahii TaxID=228899 RepID=UPI0037F7557F